MSNMDTPPQTERVFSVQEARNEIEMIRGMIGQFGAITNEMDLLDNILVDMKSDKITPNKAVEMANVVMTSKNGFTTMYR